MLLAYVLIWTAFLIIGSVIFFHFVYAAITTIEILVGLLMDAIESVSNMFKENK
jgi:dolichyl-phosphate-mannose--protein O-mannosyl transferase